MMMILLGSTLVTCVVGFQSPVLSTFSTTALKAETGAIPFLKTPAALDGSMYGDKGAPFFCQDIVTIRVGFDPLGFTSLDWNMAEMIIPKKAALRFTPEAPDLPMLSWMREAELKHGRICMIAIVGYISVDLGLKFPGAKYAGLTSLTAHDANVANGNMGFLLSVIFLIELISGAAITQMATGSGRAPGDFALDPLGFTKGDKKAFYYEAEIAHARLAMLPSVPKSKYLSFVGLHFYFRTVLRSRSCDHSKARRKKFLIFLHFFFYFLIFWFSDFSDFFSATFFSN